MQHTRSATVQERAVHSAEVLESGLTQWQAAAVDIYGYPGFGSLLTIPDGAGSLYGVVAGVTVAAGDAVHTPVPLGLSREELARLYPDSALHTRVMLTCTTVGFREEQQVFYQLPAHPPPLHALVFEAPDSDYERFFATERYLALLICHQQTAGVPREELMLAVIAQRQRRAPFSLVQLQRCVHAIAPFFMADYSRFRQLLQRIERVCGTL